MKLSLVAVYYIKLDISHFLLPLRCCQLLGQDMTHSVLTGTELTMQLLSLIKLSWGSKQTGSISHVSD